MEDCIFCKIAAGTVPCNKVYEDEHVLAFHDMAPQAPVHVLIIPKEHAKTLLEARSFSDETLARLLRTAANVAEELGLAESGFRIVSNSGKDAGQTVDHLHVHLMGGKALPERMA